MCQANHEFMYNSHCSFECFKFKTKMKEIAMKIAIMVYHAICSISVHIYFYCNRFHTQQKLSALPPFSPFFTIHSGWLPGGASAKLTYETITSAPSSAPIARPCRPTLVPSRCGPRRSRLAHRRLPPSTVHHRLVVFRSHSSAVRSCRNPGAPPRPAPVGRRVIRLCPRCCSQPSDTYSLLYR